MESKSRGDRDDRPPAMSASSRLIAVLTMTLFTCSDHVVSQPRSLEVTSSDDSRHHLTSSRHVAPPTAHQEDWQHAAATATRHQRSNDSDRQQEMTSSVSRTRRLPDVIIIGVKKCGTRALLEFLRAHPDVRAPGPEVHFFDRHYDKGLDWYRSRMPLTSRGQLTVEKTPSYLVSSGVAERLHNMSTDRDVRLLVVVRDPVTRALSDFTQSQFKRRRRHHREHDRRWSFERRAFIDENRNVVDTSWPAINIGLYARHVRRWLELFPRHHIHFVHGEQLIADPAAQLTDVQTFLGLRPFFTQQHFYFNATKGFPCLLRRPGTADETVHCLGQTKGRVHPTVDGDALKKLHQFYRPHNAEFYALTGINFGWH